MKKCGIYVRVSTTDQRVESQLYDLRELASQRGFEVVQEYEDRGMSGTKARRPGLGKNGFANIICPIAGVIYFGVLRAMARAPPSG